MRITPSVAIITRLIVPLLTAGRPMLCSGRVTVTTSN
jgi:hypothetical protein